MCHLVINLSEEHDSIIVRHAGLHINGAEEALRQLEMFARLGDMAGTMASAQRAKEHLEKVLSVGAWATLREDT